VSGEISIKMYWPEGCAKPPAYPHACSIECRALQQGVTGVGLQWIDVDAVYPLLVVIGVDAVKHEITHELDVSSALAKIGPAINLEIRAQCTCLEIQTALVIGYAAIAVGVTRGTTSAPPPLEAPIKCGGSCRRSSDHRAIRQPFAH
jgi:hypothetical protein